LGAGGLADVSNYKAIAERIQVSGYCSAINARAATESVFFANRFNGSVVIDRVFHS
jgi:hypothetical protein